MSAQPIPCIGKDAACPCQDGDVCHYVATADTPAWKIPQTLSKGEEFFALHCRVENLHPIREYLFHPTRKWRFDFAFPAALIAIEIEGRGRHQSFGGFTADCVKYNAAAKLGWKVLRYTPAMVKAGDAINDVLEMINAK